MGLTTREFAERRPAWQWAALVGVSALVVLLVLLLVVPSGNDGNDNNSSQAHAPGVPTATTGKGSLLPQTPTLQRSPGDPQWLTAPPHRVSWQRVDGVPFPFSDSDGPTHIRGAIASGYSHTPQGAVLAAAHITFRITWSPDYAEVLAAQAKVTDATRTAVLSARDHGGNVDAAMLARVAHAPVAFQVARYTPAQATVYLAFPSRTDVYRFATVAVVWDDGDWKYSDIVDPTVPSPLPDAPTLRGFTSLEEEHK